MFGFFKRRRRERLRAAPFPPEWDGILRKNVPLYGRLDEADRRELHGHIQVFLAEKHFEGCGGLDLTDEIRVTIAAQACLLLLHRETDYYRRLVTILVYPSAYVGQGRRADGRGCRPGGRGGPPRRGVDRRAWSSSPGTTCGRGRADIHDGHNVVLHEFAHQLDQEDGAADGAPILDRRQPVRGLGRVLGAEYEQLRRDSRAGPAERARRVRGDQPGRVLRRGDRVLLREAGPAEAEAPGALRGAEGVLPPGPRAGRHRGRRGLIGRNGLNGGDWLLPRVAGWNTVQ